MSIRCGVRWNRNWRRNRLCRKRPRQRPGRPLRETALLGLATSLCPSAGRYPDVHRLSSGRSIAKNCHSKTASIKMDYPLTVTTKPEPVWAGSRQAGGIVTQTANRVSPSGLVSAVADPRPRQTAIAQHAAAASFCKQFMVLPFPSDPSNPASVPIPTFSRHSTSRSRVTPRCPKG